MIFIVDFGSQTTHLIARRIRDLGVEVKIVDPDKAYRLARESSPAGIVFSGGPASVYKKDSPTINKRLFDLGIPFLAICYGWQLLAKLMGGKVVAGGKEYGPAKLQIKDFHNLFYGFPIYCRVWESHGDTVVRPPRKFKILACTKGVRCAAVGNLRKKFYGVQFHPEMSHTQHGRLLFKNYVSRICNLGLKPKRIEIKQLIKEIKEKAGAYQVIGAISGGTDSTVAGTLAAKAVGRQFIPVYIESGLMRQGTVEKVTQDLTKQWGIRIKTIRAKGKFLTNLKGIVDPEKKRKIIGRLYIELFEREMRKHKKVRFLLQGTTYADFIHSQGTRRSALIKSHHNVGGLPKKMKLELIEPIRYFYTDQVRHLGLKLGLPKEVVYQQPFPGPGHAVRIVGEVTRERLKRQILADAIVVEELKKAGWYDKVFQCWPVMTGADSTAVKGDSRFFGEVAALRVIQSRDRMTADWVRLPYSLLAKISSRIVNEIPGLSRVVYDITTKPPATMEWE